MCRYYTLDFHGCKCRFRCPHKPTERCEGLTQDKKRGKIKQKLWENTHRAKSMVTTWETSELKCPYCRVVSDFTIKNFDRAKKEGLWVGKNGKVDMKFLEKNIDRGCTDVSKVWGKPKSHVLQVMYDIEMEFGGSGTSSGTENIQQPLQPPTQESLPPRILQSRTVEHTASDKIKDPSLPPQTRQPLPRRIGNQLIQLRSDKTLPSLPSQALPYIPPTSKKRSRSDMNGIILERTMFKKPRIASSLGDIAEHLSERLSRIGMDDERDPLLKLSGIL